MLVWGGCGTPVGNPVTLKAANQDVETRFRGCLPPLLSGRLAIRPGAIASRSPLRAVVSLDRVRGMDPALASRCHHTLEPLHALIYFAPEGDEHFTNLGLRAGRMGYFASRSAPLGAVSTSVVTATFYNFNPALVANYIPQAWTIASPERIIASRFEAVDAALRRLLGGDLIESATMREAAELAAEATTACTPEGRPLYAGHADLQWPTSPHLMLWHALSLLREHRGDGHIATLVAHELDGLAALITHTATGTGFRTEVAKSLRGWSDEQWDAGVERLHTDGILDSGGELTERGAAQRQRIEEQTDALALAPWVHLGDQKAERLRGLGRELADKALAEGAIPAGVFAGQ